MNRLAPKGADYARQAVADCAKNRHADAREATARYIAEGGAGANYTLEGRAVWQEYLAAGCPASNKGA